MGTPTTRRLARSDDWGGAPAEAQQISRSPVAASVPWGSKKAAGQLLGWTLRAKQARHPENLREQREGLGDFEHVLLGGDLVRHLDLVEIWIKHR